jgi:hypothetical protein
MDFHQLGIAMLLIAQIFAAIVLLLHVYFVLLETVLFRSRGAKVFGIPKDQVESRAAAMSNQGCYNGFLVAAIALGFFYPDALWLRVFGVARRFRRRFFSFKRCRRLLHSVRSFSSVKPGIRFG